MGMAAIPYASLMELLRSICERTPPRTYALAGCLACTAVYVGLLYVWRGLPRSHPGTVRRRMLSVVTACSVAWLPLAGALPHVSESPPNGKVQEHHADAQAQHVRLHGSIEFAFATTGKGLKRGIGYRDRFQLRVFTHAGACCMMLKLVHAVRCNTQGASVGKALGLTCAGLPGVVVRPLALTMTFFGGPLLLRMADSNMRARIRDAAGAPMPVPMPACVHVHGPACACACACVYDWVCAYVPVCVCGRTWACILLYICPRVGVPC